MLRTNWMTRKTLCLQHITSSKKMICRPLALSHIPQIMPRLQDSGHLSLIISMSLSMKNHFRATVMDQLPSR
jgi:hypothetical protein